MTTHTRRILTKLVCLIASIYAPYATFKVDMNYSTWRVITRFIIKPIPISDQIIKLVEDYATKQGHPKGLKITDWSGNLIPDVDTTFDPDALIAGVNNQQNQNHYQDQQQQQHGEDSDDEEYESTEHYVDDDGFDEHDDDDAWSFEEVKQDEIDDLLADQQEDDEVRSAASERDNDDAEDEAQQDDTVDGPRTRQQAQPFNISTTTGQSYFQLDEERQHEIDCCHNLVHQTADRYEYDDSEINIMAMLIEEINKYDEVSFAQQYLLNQGLKRFGDKGRAAVKKEVKQLHDRVCFRPIDVKSLMKEEKRKAQVALLFLTEKRDTTIKARQVYNGKPTRQWLSREDSASPTASLESLLLLGVIDVKEKRDVMCVDIPNAFIQAKLENGPELKERIVMKITGVLVDILVDIAPHIYSGFVVYEKRKKVLYVQVLRALYGMLIAALVWYKKFKQDLMDEGFVFNFFENKLRT